MQETEVITEGKRKQDLRLGLGGGWQSQGEEMRRSKLRSICYTEEVHQVHGSSSLYCPSFYLFAFYLVAEPENNPFVNDITR